MFENHHVEEYLTTRGNTHRRLLSRGEKKQQFVKDYGKYQCLVFFLGVSPYFYFSINTQYIVYLIFYNRQVNR